MLRRIPTEASSTTRLEPPYETNGSGIPVSGAIAHHGRDVDRGLPADEHREARREQLPERVAAAAGDLQAGPREQRVDGDQPRRRRRARAPRRCSRASCRCAPRAGRRSSARPGRARRRRSRRSRSRSAPARSGSRCPARRATGAGTRRSGRGGTARARSRSCRARHARPTPPASVGSGVPATSSIAASMIRIAIAVPRSGSSTSSSEKSAGEQPDRPGELAQAPRRRAAGEVRRGPHGERELRELGRLEDGRADRDPAARAVDRRPDDEHGGEQDERDQDERLREQAQAPVVPVRARRPAARSRARRRGPAARGSSSGSGRRPRPRRTWPSRPSRARTRRARGSRGRAPSIRARRASFGSDSDVSREILGAAAVADSRLEFSTGRARRRQPSRRKCNRRSTDGAKSLHLAGATPDMSGGSHRHENVRGSDLPARARPVGTGPRASRRRATAAGSRRGGRRRPGRACPPGSRP